MCLHGLLQLLFACLMKWRNCYVCYGHGSTNRSLSTGEKTGTKTKRKKKKKTRIVTSRTTPLFWKVSVWTRMVLFSEGRFMNPSMSTTPRNKPLLPGARNCQSCYTAVHNKKCIYSEIKTVNQINNNALGGVQSRDLYATETTSSSNPSSDAAIAIG
jgi:hypothetical protein